jgi:hypothetical protein
MPLLPLVLSVQVSPMMAGGDEWQEPLCRPGEILPCQFCGCAAAGWQVALPHADDDAGHAPVGGTSCCVLCELSLRLNRPAIAQEAMLVWLPEMSQAALNVLACRIHLVLHRHDEPPHMERRPQIDTPAIRGAWCALTALQARAAAAAARLGTTAPCDLAAALLRLSPSAYARRGALLSGVRLLPRGRYFRNGEDIYPQLLDALPTGA